MVDSLQEHPEAQNASPQTPRRQLGKLCWTLQNTALALLHSMRVRLRGLNDKFQNWNGYHQAQFKDYCKQKVRGEEISRSEFDVALLVRQRELTGAIVKAEKGVEKTITDARNLGAVLDEHDQESGSIGKSDDGYRESLEVAIIARVDRKEFSGGWITQKIYRKKSTIARTGTSQGQSTYLTVSV